MNVFERIEKYLPKVLDAVFASESLTKDLEGAEKYVDLNFKEAGYVKIMSIAMDGLSDYYRAQGALTGNNYSNLPHNSGYRIGDVEATWEVFSLRYDRGKQFKIDAMDDEEMAGQIIANVLGEFLRTQVVPEVDAVRFSTLASKASATLGNLVNKTIAPNTIISEFNSAFKWFAEHEVPAQDQIIYVNPSVMEMIRNTDELVKHLTQAEYKSGDVTFAFERYEGRKIIEVPSNRFFTDVQCGENGFYAGANSKQINYLICSKKAVVPVVKHEKSKIFGPEVVQDYDGYKINFRMYHDTLVPRNKLAGVYVSVGENAGSTVSRLLSVNVVKDDTGYKVTEFFTNPAGIIPTKMIYSKEALKAGDKFVSNASKNKQITLGVRFTKIDTETKGYFALVDEADNILAVSKEITLPLN